MFRLEVELIVRVVVLLVGVGCVLALFWAFGPKRRRPPRKPPRGLGHYLADLGRYRVFTSTRPGIPHWAEVVARAGDKLMLSDGSTIDEQFVHAFAVTYPSGTMVAVEPKNAWPLPAGVQTAEDVGPEVEHHLALTDLAPERAGVTVTFTPVDSATADKKGHFTTRLTNTRTEAVRIVRFAGYRDAGDHYALHTITGAFFTATDFREWYAVPDPEGWIETGESVEDPANYGALDSLWAYEVETRSGERFWTGAVPQQQLS
jgi:hypothetical protein